MGRRYTRIIFYSRLLILLLLLCFSNSQHLFGQTSNYLTETQKDPSLISVATPGAASLGKYGQVPVDLYNGLFDLSIPVYQLPVKGQNIGIKLSYHSGGVKPNEKGGVLGVGWSLMASGSITRIQNGTIDEWVNTSYTDSLKGYFYNQSQLNKSGWDGADSIFYFLSSLGCETCGLRPWHDWAPDEFAFNFLGYSGSFWLDNLGNWVVRESSGEKMKVVVDFGPYTYKYPLAQSVTVSRCFRKFTLTDGNGNSFVFGGDSTSVEFNRVLGLANPPATASSWYLTQVLTNKAEKVKFSYTRLWPSSSAFSGMNNYYINYGGTPYYEWNLETVSPVLHDPVYLTDITYNNLNVNFQYLKTNINSYCCDAINPNVSKYTVPGGDITSFIQGIGAPTEPPNDANGSPVPRDYQLSKILVTYGNDSKQWNFTYYDSVSSNRLFLKKINQGPVQRPLITSFIYNGTSFFISSDSLWKIQDGLLTKKIDHWGYYNGKFPMKTSALPLTAGTYATAGTNGSSVPYLTQDFISSYIANRQPNADSMKIGSLARVIYPTGGYTDFTYEPHLYSSQLDSVTNMGQFLASNKMAGGLRIKKIVSYPDSTNSVPIVKQYRYLNDNGYSSGILNSAGVLYTDSLNGNTGSGVNVMFRYFYDNNQLPLQNTAGNNVTYTKVDEITGDSSKTTYRYYNFDNGHHDLNPVVYSSATVNAAYYRKNNSRGFQRGRLYSQTLYDSAGNRVSQNNMAYKNDDSLTNNHVGVRSYAFSAKDYRMGSFYTKSGNMVAVFQEGRIWSPNISPYVHYVHDYPVVQKTDTLFNSAAFIATKDTFLYSSTNNKAISHSTFNYSNGSSKTETFNYPFDYTAGNSFYSGMVSSNVIDPVIKKTVTDNTGKTLLVNKDSLTKTTINSSDFFWLYERQQYQVATDITRMNVLKYDTVGNPIYAKGADGVPMAYLWNYSSIYPAAVVKYADNTSIAYTSFEGENNGNWKLPDATRNIAYSVTGLQSYDLTSTKTIYDSVPAGKQYIVSYWSKSSTPITVKSNGTSVGSSLTGLTKNGWTYFEHLLPSTTVAVTLTAATTTTIDEVRLYPSTSQMTTYTYAPLDGISSISAPNGMINYYDYDAFSRLYKIRDMDNNIVKLYDYQYQRLAKPIGNAQQVVSFAKSNCSTGCAGSTVYDTAKANTFFSYLSIADANQQAINYLNANGQHYADSLGNCNYVALTCSQNAGGSGWYATFTKGTDVFTFQVPSGGTNVYMGLLLGGRYSVTITNASNTTISYDFTAGALATSGTSASFSLVPMSCANYTISIQNPH